MNIYLGYPSALEYLRLAADCPGFAPATLDACALTNAVATVSALRGAGLVGAGACAATRLSEPVHVLLADNRGASRGTAVTRRLWSGTVPRRSLCRAAAPQPSAAQAGMPDVLVSTPGFCLLQAARLLAFEDLMQLVLELCGSYSSGARSVEGRCDLTPLTSTRSLASYLSGAGDGRAACRARRAAALALDGMASPMESVAYLLLCLPRRLGGYGLPKPLANARVDVPPDLRRYHSFSFVRPDLCWPRARLVVEYDSDEHHAGGRRAARDSARRSLLMSMGYEVHSVNLALLGSERDLDQLARRAASLLGAHVGRESSAELERRRLLRSRLLDRRRDWKHERRSPGERDGSRRAPRTRGR